MLNFLLLSSLHARQSTSHSICFIYNKNTRAKKRILFEFKIDNQVVMTFRYIISIRYRYQSKTGSTRCVSLKPATVDTVRDPFDDIKVVYQTCVVTV